MADKYSRTAGHAQPEVMDKWLKQEQIDPKRSERGTMNAFERIAYGIHHEFWNIMDDVYVNSLVAKRKPMYGESGKHASAVVSGAII